jgi:RNA polymerase-binding transcription factor DksA
MTKNNFTSEFLEKIKSTLLEEKNRIEGELSRFSSRKNKEDFEANYPEYGDKEDENAAEIADYAAEVPLEESLEKTLRDTNQALSRIEKGGLRYLQILQKTDRRKTSACQTNLKRLHLLQKSYHPGGLICL